MNQKEWLAKVWGLIERLEYDNSSALECIPIFAEAVAEIKRQGRVIERRGSALEEWSRWEQSGSPRDESPSVRYIEAALAYDGSEGTRDYREWRKQALQNPEVKKEFNKK